jgi:hypothetical protein
MPPSPDPLIEWPQGSGGTAEEVPIVAPEQQPIGVDLAAVELLAVELAPCMCSEAEVVAATPVAAARMPWVEPGT